MVYNGDFALGNTGFSTSYTYSNSASPGLYGITVNSNLANPWYWGNCMDHTTGNDKFMWIDLSSNSSVNIWTQQINGLVQNKNYLFSCWINTLDASAPGTLQFSINSILVGLPFTSPVTLCNWEKFCFLWNSGNNSSATITITNQSQYSGGNDVGIDDISFRECTPTTYSYEYSTICSGQDYQLPSGLWINSSGIYIDTLQSANGCDSVVTTNLTVNPPFCDSIEVSICSGEFYILPAGDTVYSSGIYMDSLTSLLGCDSLIYTFLTLNPSYLSVDSVLICSDQFYILPNQDTVYDSGIYYDTLKTHFGCDSIIITVIEKLPQNVQNVSVNICFGDFYILPQGQIITNPGVYIDTLQSIYGCDSVIITNLSVSAPIVNQVFDGICYGEGYTLPDGQVVFINGIYIDTLQTLEGCDSIVEITLSLLDELRDSVITKDLSCYEAEDGRITLFLENGIGPITYEIENKGINTIGVFEHLPAGHYVYTITDGNGCAVTDTIDLLQPEPISLKVSPSDTLIEPHGYVPIIALCSNPSATFSWSPDNYLTCDTCSSTISTPYGEIEYTLTATVIINGASCKAATKVIIHMAPTLFAPSAFTPNGDGINDYFEAPNLNLSQLSIEIYDRWGNKVFQSNELDFKWDGKMNAVPCPFGVYSFCIRARNYSNKALTLMGTITLIR